MQLLAVLAAGKQLRMLVLGALGASSSVASSQSPPRLPWASLCPESVVPSRPFSGNALAHDLSDIEDPPLHARIAVRTASSTATTPLQLHRSHEHPTVSTDSSPSRDTAAPLFLRRASTGSVVRIRHACMRHARALTGQPGRGI
jgi:hypothetical protein